MTHEEQTIEHMIKAARHVSLRDGESAEIRKNIHSFMTEHPVRVTLLARILSRIRVPQMGLIISPVSHVRPALAGLLIVLVTVTGTSYAAADALPGDILYAVKTRLNENLEKALAFSDEAKADVSAKFAVRRLEEAETLIAQGRMTESARTEIESRFDEHATQFETRIASIEEGEGSTEVAAEAQSDLEVSLKAHRALLTDLSGRRPEAESILAKVEARTRKVESARTESERVLSGKSDGRVRAAALAKKRVIEDEVASGRVNAPTSSADTAVMMMSALEESAKIAPSQDPVLEALETGSMKIDEGKYGEAFTTFQGAIRKFQQVKLDSDVRERFKFDEMNDEEERGATEDAEDREHNDVPKEPDYPHK